MRYCFVCFLGYNQAYDLSMPAYWTARVQKNTVLEACKILFSTIKPTASKYWEYST